MMNRKITKRETTVATTLLTVLLLVSPVSWAGDIKGTVSAKDKSKVVIYLEGAAGAVRPVRVLMDQLNKLFVPYVLPVMKGATVDFLNSDALQHNVFGVGDDEFDLGNWTRGVRREHTFNQPGEVVILCNVHPEMEAYILVFDHPFFATLREDGSFTITGVPAGNYTIKAWYRGKTRKKKVTVPATGSVTVAF